MEYQKIMCEFCKECKELKIVKRVVKTTNYDGSDTIVIKCDNFCPKYHFDTESNRPKYCSFYIGVYNGGYNDDCIESSTLSTPTKRGK